jgi:hypothetical protein
MKHLLTTITIVLLYGPVKLDYTVYKNVPEIYFTPKKIRVIMFFKKVAAKAKWSVSRKRFIFKNPPEFFFTLDASVGWGGGDFVKIGDDFGAGR